MTAARSADGLLKATRRRRADARRKIRKALREMQRDGLAINPHAVARYAGVSRKTIYNHDDLRDEIREAAATLRPRIADSAPGGRKTGSATTAALQHQLRTQRREFDTELATLKAEIKDLNQQLAVAHGEIHRLRGGSATG